MTSSLPFHAHHVVVTGGSRGIGRATALAFAAAGARVLALGRDRAALAEVQASAASLPGAVVTGTVEATDRVGLAQAVDAAFGPQAPVHVLVVNAGISLQTPITGDKDVDEAWSAQIRTNLTAAWAAVRAVVPRQPHGGRIVTVSSDLGRMGAPGFGAYAASKHGLIGLTRALAQELAPRGIRINAICPGWVDTAMAARSFAEMGADLGLPAEEVMAAEVEALPLQRLVRPEEVAALTLFLAGPGGAAISGQCFGIDAGTTPFD